MTWGIAENVVERFLGAEIAPKSITCEPDTFVFDAAVSPTEYLTWCRRYYGPTMSAFDAAGQSGRVDELFGEVDELFNGQNTSPDPPTTAIPATSL